ncbi:G-box-binding factor 4-like isoform X1 [Sesbania bispinosa]|nr:G-box-binding factor 4-like isoform X1 [Sesbania bispinosa]
MTNGGRLSLEECKKEAHNKIMTLKDFLTKAGDVNEEEEVKKLVLLTKGLMAMSTEVLRLILLRFKGWKK